jgi:hypothetical protein
VRVAVPVGEHGGDARRDASAQQGGDDHREHEGPGRGRGGLTHTGLRMLSIAEATLKSV